MITGTTDYQQMFQNELWEVVRVPSDDRPFIMPIVKLSGDSDVAIRADALPISVAATFLDSLYLSEFSELRVAPPGNRSDTEFIYDAQPLLYDSVVVSGSVSFQTGTRDVVLSTIGYSGTYSALLRKHYWVPYTPGSGQEIDITGVLNMSGVTGTASVFLRSSVTGTTSVYEIPQSQWLASQSGINWGNSQIMRMSFQSLKVGRIQFTLVQDGVPVKVAQILNANKRSSGYWQYPSLPPYFKVFHLSTGTVTEIGYGDDYNGIGFRYFSAPEPNQKVRAICETVKSQGGVSIEDLLGFPGEIDNYLTPVTVSTSLIPVLSIRVAPTFRGLINRSIIRPISLSLSTNNAIYYRVLYRPTLTGASWVDVNSNHSGVQYDVTASAIANTELVVDADYITSGVRNQQIVDSGFLERISMSLGSTGTSDILTIAAIRTDANNASVSAAIKWEELR